MKARKRFNLLDWGTPKRVVLAETTVPSEMKRKPAKKDKNICKVTKEAHEYELRQSYAWTNHIWEGICKGCGKKDWKQTRYLHNGEFLTFEEYIRRERKDGKEA